MKTQKKSETEHPSKGVLIFAFNNSTFDYVRSAEFAAEQVAIYLGLPVTLVTDKPVESKWFSIVLVVNSAEKNHRQYLAHDGTVHDIQWLNKSRTSAYELSPYDQTLLIDADYFMFNDTLKHIFDTKSEMACFDRINDVTGVERDVTRLSDISIPMLWATVLYFTKCDFSKSVFEFMDIIKNNWEYYALLYNFRGNTYRNDYALSIALQALAGYSTLNFNRLPGKLHTIFSNVEIVKVKDNTVTFLYGNQINKVINTNIHCMNKIHITKFYD